MCRLGTIFAKASSQLMKSSENRELTGLNAVVGRKYFDMCFELVLRKELHTDSYDITGAIRVRFVRVGARVVEESGKVERFDLNQISLSSALMETPENSDVSGSSRMLIWHSMAKALTVLR